jgi:hypothetical protein
MNANNPNCQSQFVAFPVPNYGILNKFDNEKEIDEMMKIHKAVIIAAL